MTRKEEFANAVSYHKLTADDTEVIDKFAVIRQAAKDFGDVVLDNTEPSREQSLALTHIEDALMWAIKQVAITKLPVVEPLN